MMSFFIIFDGAARESAQNHTTTRAKTTALDQTNGRNFITRSFGGVKQESPLKRAFQRRFVVSA